MYNPFPLLNEALLDAEIAKGKCLFVRQGFSRGMDAPLRAAFLLRAYIAEEKDAAEKHMAAIARDPNAFLYDAGVPEHLKKLIIAASQPIGFRIYYAAKKGMDWDPPLVYQEKMRRYLRRHHAGWRTTRGGEKIQIGLYEEFGELFLKFSYEGEHDHIPFDEIEKY
jgi:hypothetical protein